MKKIVNMLKSFSDEERALVKKNFYKNSKYPKSSHLFDKINQKVESDDCLVAEDIYDSPHGSSYSHLKRRLKEGIIDIIYNAELSEQLGNSVSSGKTKCYKYLAIASMLIEKGLADEAMYYMNAANKIITERHFTSERLIYNLLLIEVSSNFDDDKLIPKKIKDDLDELNSLSKSKMDFYKIHNNDEKEPDEKERPIAENNPMVVYYNLFAEVNFCLEMALYETATGYSNRLNNLIQQAPKCFNQKEFIKAKLVHAKCLVFNKDFASAASLISQIEVLKLNHVEYKIDLVVLKWLVAFFTKDHSKAHRYVEDLHVLNTENKSTEPLIKYLAMCLLFEQKEFKAIQDLLLSDSAFQNPKNPFLFAIKTLDIYCLIEMAKNELAYSKVLAFKQYLKRSDSINKIRYQFILKILIRLIKNNFRFGTVQDYYKNYKESSENNDIRFIPDLSHYELITLENWLFVGHVEVENYQRLEIAE